MAIDQTVIPISNVKLGIKQETTFGTLLDSDGTNTQAFRQLPIVQAQKPTFNITRESRLLSGRGTVKNAADTVITNKNGTVTCPFDFLATPELLLEHLAMVTNTYAAAGSNKYVVEIDGSNNATSIGGAISSGIPHTVNLAYYPAASQGITIPGCTVSDLNLACDYGADGGNLRMSGNYFSGFSNIFSSSGTGCLLEDNYTGTWVEPDAGQFFNIGNLGAKSLEIDGASQDIILKSFNLNIANGVNRVGSNSVGGAEAYAFPEYVATGNIVVKYDGEAGLSADENVVQSFIDGQTCLLTLQFGDATPSSTGEMIILAEVQFTGDPTQDVSENGIFWNIPFECVQNGSDEALEISLFSDTALGSM